MMKRKKSSGWTFIFSLLPGAAEMYMGFMKRGMSIMAIFFGSWIVPSLLRVSDVFVLFAIMIWFFGFFHARNLAACSEEELKSIPDDFVWESWGNLGKLKIPSPALKKWSAVILIVYGLSLLWQTFCHMIYQFLPEQMVKYIEPIIYEVPQVAVAIIIIVVGIKLIAGKKVELDGKGE